MHTSRMHDHSHTPWWRRAAIYQVYVRSFADGNGDGTGDIAGLRSRLPYLASLGIDGIWVNPWYPSPLNDGGYDVADYRDVNPQLLAPPQDFDGASRPRIVWDTTDYWVQGINVGLEYRW